MDELDRAQAAAEVYEDAALRSHFNKRKLEQMQTANAGDEHRCIDCKEIIPRARIEAKPNAVRCIVCQSLFEREV